MWGVKEDLLDTGDDEGLWYYELLEEGALFVLDLYVIDFGLLERKGSIRRWIESKRKLTTTKTARRNWLKFNATGR